MKKFLSCIFFIHVSVIIFCPSEVFSQIGQFYTWQDTLSVSTTHIDTTWETSWSQVTIWADTVDCYMIFGAPDTTSWKLRKPVKIDAGNTISFGPATKLKRLEVWTRSGTGTLFFIGYKTGAQY